MGEFLHFPQPPLIPKRKDRVLPDTAFPVCFFPISGKPNAPACINTRSVQLRDPCNRHIDRLYLIPGGIVHDAADR